MAAKLVLLPGELAGGRHASILRRAFEQGVIDAQQKGGLQWRSRARPFNAKKPAFGRSRLL